MKLTEDYQKYLSAWKKRIRSQQRECKKKGRLAGKLAHRMARILVEKFSALRVYLAGALAEGYFHDGSDIDRHEQAC